MLGITISCFTYLMENPARVVLNCFGEQGISNDVVKSDESLVFLSLFTGQSSLPFKEKTHMQEVFHSVPGHTNSTLNCF
jgi:hypothetical protein